ncbi:hypothetical protein Bca4012_038346 [Brassica carinata]
MLFPSGQMPLITITNTAELVSVMNRRPPLNDVTLLLTLGAKDVAEYQFLCRSDFSIGSTTYVVGDNQDERAKDTYESFVFGERLITCEAVMNEIYGEQEMLIFHRVALEMGYADRVLRPQAGVGVVNGMEIIYLDDDDDMVDQPRLPPISPSAAPSVLWDVGQDLLEYPEFNNAQRDGNLVPSDTEFWNGLMEESCNCCDELFIVGNGLGQAQGFGEGVITEIVNDETGENDTSRAALLQDETDSSSGSAHVVCSQLRSGIPMGGKEAEDDRILQEEGQAEIEKTKVTTEATNTSQSPGQKLTLACRYVEGGTQEMGRVNVVETSSKGSGTEGAY